jgi:branched-subunit amino acid ABC-type transport system permease component
MQLEPYATRFRHLRWALAGALLALPVMAAWSGVSFSATGLAEQVLIGLILGSIYALIALGYTLVYGVIKLINFAHGDIYMLGAFLGYYLLRLTIRYFHFINGLPLVWCYIISTIVSAIICALLAMLMERLAYRPIRRSTRIAALITAVGVSFLLENMGIIVFGPNPKSYEPKTLEVYQLQLAAAADFSQARQMEIRESAQHVFPAARFTQTTYARVRVVTRNGSSGWSPVLTIDPAQPGGFAEQQPAAAGVPQRPQPIPSLGFTRKKEQGRDQVVVSWVPGAAADTSLNPVFSDAQGNQLAWYYPPAASAPPGAAPDAPAATDEQIRIPVFSVVIIGVTLLLLWGLHLLITRTMFGISMRALSYDMQAAKLMGVNTDRVITITFAIGGACAAVAGNMVGIYNQCIEPLMGILPGLKAFVAAVVGGIGSIPGAAAGGLIMGLSEALVKGYINPRWSGLADAMAFAILIAVLLFKPSGIFGTTLREKV